MPRETFDAITESQIKKASIATLADRPNSVSRYGDSNLSAQELKERFDAFPYLVQKKINEIIDALASASASKYITLDAHSTGKDNLYDFIALFTKDASNGKSIADLIYALYTAEQASSPASKSISEIFNDMASRLAALESARVALQESVSNHETRISANESGISNHEERISSNESGISNHEERISGIERYLGGDNFIVDDAIAYQKDVPKNAVGKAKILKIGGMTYKSKNLVPYPYANTSKTEEGITWTVNDDGSVSVSGTATANSVFYLYDAKKLPPGISKGTTVMVSAGRGASSINTSATFSVNYYREEGSVGSGTNSVTNGASNTWTVPENAIGLQLYLVVISGRTVNHTVYPQIELGSKTTAYEPYFSGLRNAKATELKSEGANLIPYPYKQTTRSESGITFTDNGDGSISVKGTATLNSVFYLYDNRKECPFVKQGEYYSRNMVDGRDGVYFTVNYYSKGRANDASYSAWIVGSTAKTPTDFEGCIMYIIVLSGTTVDTTVTPMLNHGLVSVPYKPYVGTIDTFAIPEAVLDHDECGIGANSTYYNYIEFYRKKIIKNCKKLVFDGSEDWQLAWGKTPEHRYFYLTIGEYGYVTDYRDAICSHYAMKSISADNLNIGADVLNSTSYNDARILIRTETPMDLDAFKAMLSEWATAGNPLTIVYTITAPEVIDISNHLNNIDNLIKVEGGGTITAVNEHNFAAPSSIKYLVTYPKEV